MHAYHVRGKEKTFSSFFFQRRPLTLDFPIRRRSSIEEFPIPGWGESWIYRIRDVKASLFSPPLPSSINSMHLFGDAELDQGLRPQAQVGARRLKIAGQDAFELFNLPSMERRRHLLRSLPSFPSRPSHPWPLSRPPSTPLPLGVAKPGCSTLAETMNLIFEETVLSFFPKGYFCRKFF